MHSWVLWDLKGNNIYNHLNIYIYLQINYLGTTELEMGPETTDDSASALAEA